MSWVQFTARQTRGGASRGSKHRAGRNGRHLVPAFPIRMSPHEKTSHHVHAVGGLDWILRELVTETAP